MLEPSVPGTLNVAWATEIVDERHFVARAAVPGSKRARERLLGLGRVATDVAHKFAPASTRAEGASSVDTRRLARSGFLVLSARGRKAGAGGSWSVGADVGAGRGWAVGAGSGRAVGAGRGWAVGTGRGWAVGAARVGAGVGAGAGAGVGSGRFVGVGVG